MAMTVEAGHRLWQARAAGWVPKFIEVHGDRYDYSQIDKRVLDQGIWKVEIVCHEHGPFLQRPVKHLSGQGCPVCAGNAVGDYLKKLRETYPEWDFPDNLEVTGSKAKITLTCPVHGAFLTTFNRLTTKKGTATPCPRCSKVGGGLKRRLGDEEILARLSAMYPKYTFHPHAGMRINDKIEYVCPDHGMRHSVINDMFTGHACSGCGAVSRRRGIVEALGVSPKQNVLDVFAAHGGRIIPHYGSISGTHEMVRATCIDHGSFETRLYALKAGSGCPRCSNRISKAEVEIKAWLEQLGEGVQTQVRGLLERGELDLYLPERKLAIEYCGLYWHGDSITADRDKHRRKLRDAESKGVRLLTIFEDEWVLRQPAVKALLLGILGRQDATHARKLTVKQVAWGTAAEFYDAWHLQGAGTPCGENIALMDGEGVVSCVSFRNDRFGPYDYELLRYATRKRVTGGMSRLIAAFAKKHVGQTLVSYCDLRWFTGGVYARAGFEFRGETAPGYGWCKGSRRYSRFRFQKHKLSTQLDTFDPDKTEDENMRTNRYWKIWDCGMQKWIKHL